MLSRGEPYLDIWEGTSPEMLADKQEAFDDIQRSLPSGPKRHVKASGTFNDGKQKKKKCSFDLRTEKWNKASKSQQAP
ncbi:hypothetical protein TNCV_3168861 [Trichonephila clavipes]|nr:hypothetical protein TNCV_3168861 [Trichonephila clavipes]